VLPRKFISIGDRLLGALSTKSWLGLRFGIIVAALAGLALPIAWVVDNSMALRGSGVSSFWQEGPSLSIKFIVFSFIAAMVGGMIGGLADYWVLRSSASLRRTIFSLGRAILLAAVVYAGFFVAGAIVSSWIIIFTSPWAG